MFFFQGEYLFFIIYFTSIFKVALFGLEKVAPGNEKSRSKLQSWD
jgi:hypothetical protein